MARRAPSGALDEGVGSSCGDTDGTIYDCHQQRDERLGLLEMGEFLSDAGRYSAAMPSGSVPAMRLPVKIAIREGRALAATEDHQLGARWGDHGAAIASWRYLQSAASHQLRE
jgi:hypothetical protein